MNLALGKDLAIYAMAALCEIGGCFAFWRWLRDGFSPWIVLPGMVSLALFAFLLTKVDSAAAGRAYAAYGGVYILASFFWLRVVEGVRPTLFDIVGVLVSLLGTCIILAGPRLSR